ncbi:hypothetical protein IKT18_02825 [Candidatus Saccharibacteria bacterium]|nr:hypothetical protein [Candidatus Saccharibacteria bacterium]
MSSKLLINVNDASSAVVPDTSAPDTGMFSVSHTDGVSFNTSMVLPIVGIAVLTVAIIVGIVVAISRHKKVNRFTTHTNKHLVAKLTTLSVVVLLGALGILNADKLTSMVNAADNSEEDTLTIMASDIKIDVDLNNKAVFATGESTVTVSSATEAGYTLMAYVDSTTTDLTNETNKSSKSTIAMLNSNEPTALTDNTWGLSTTKPTDQTSEVFTGLPTTQETALTLKTTEEATTANDKSTFYYGTYITPDLDYGTYSGATITYVAIANITELCNPNATTIQEAVCMQDFAGPNRDQIVDSMTPETQYILIDKRDEKSYTIAKLRTFSGEIPKNVFLEYSYAVWMTQNLDLDLDSNTTYTNEDTDLGYNTRTGQYESASWKPSRSTYIGTNNQQHDWCVGGEWISDNLEMHGTHCINYIPESYDPGDYYWDGVVSSNNYSTSGIPQYHLGNYYNWNAAVAMNNTSSIQYEDLTTQSICPSGWALGDDYFDLFRLWFEYGFDDYSYWYNDDDVLRSLWKEPLYFNMSGFFDGELSHISLGGFLWDPWSYDETKAYSAGFQERLAVSHPAGEAYRGLGVSVRCAVRSASPDGPAPA